MVLLGVMSHVVAYFGPFGGRVSLRNHFGRNRWYSNVTWVRWKLVLIRLEILLISAQDRCPVCAECTMGKEIDLGTPDGRPR